MAGWARGVLGAPPGLPAGRAPGACVGPSGGYVCAVPGVRPGAGVLYRGLVSSCLSVLRAMVRASRGGGGDGDGEEA